MAFRGPARSLEGRYVTFLGGTCFYGKYAEHAIPDRVEDMVRTPCVNLGLMNAGVDVLSSAPMVELANGGAATVIELVAAHNMSNQFYRVHPRRNDRLVAPRELMTKVFPELDLSEVHFTRHLLRMMQARAPNRFETVVEELRAAWVEGMCALLRALTGPKILLWVVPKPTYTVEDPLAREPYLVDRSAVHAISGLADDLVEVRETEEMRAAGLAGMDVPETRERVVSMLPRAALLEEAAGAVLDPLQRVGVGSGRVSATVQSLTG